MNRPEIWSRHESHRPIVLEPVTKKVVVNFGNSEPSDRLLGSLVINPIEAVKTCTNKVKMKEIMREHKITTPAFGLKVNAVSSIRLPIIVKRNNHSGGRGMRKINSIIELRKFLKDCKADEYYWEKYTKFDREFRVHVSAHSGEIFATEKVSKDKTIWIRNLNSCKFVREFSAVNKSAWKKMIRECLRTLSAIKLDIGGFDVGYSDKKRKFYIIECNSACGMGDNTRKAYVDELNRICKTIAN